MHLLMSALLISAMAFGTDAAAKTRRIPVRTNKAGTFNKSGKRRIKSTDSVGVFKRRGKKRRKLDPKYDPARASAAMRASNAADTPEPDEPSDDGKKKTSDSKKIEDWIKFKSNIDMTSAASGCRRAPR